MERMDSAATGLIEQEVRGRFPDGMVDSVAVLQYGDDPSVEPGQVVVQMTVAVRGRRAARIRWRPSTGPTGTRSGSSSGISRQRWPQATRFKMVTGQGDGRNASCCCGRPAPDEPPGGDLTPVMARLGPADLETLDTLIAAGFAANRAQAVRWALARIRERPAYAELRERAKEIETLKSQF